MSIISVIQGLLLLQKQLIDIPTTAVDKNLVAPPLIPRSILFGDPDRSSVGINSNGTLLCYMSPFKGTNNVWIEPLDGSRPPMPVTIDATGDIGYAYWTHNPDLLLYHQDTDGDENHRIYKVNVTSNTSTLLIGKAGSRAQRLRSSTELTDEILVSYNDRNPAYFDIYRVNLVSGEAKLVYQNNKFNNIIADNDLKLRLGTFENDFGYTEYAVLSPEVEFGTDPSFNATWITESYRNITMEASYSTWVAGFDDTNQNIFWADSVNSDTSVLALKPFNKPHEDGELLFGDGKSDISNVWSDSRTHVPFAVVTDYTKPKTNFINDEFLPDRDFLADFFKNSNGISKIADMSDDMSMWLIRLVRDDNTTITYAYNRTSKSIQFLFLSTQALANYQMSKKHPVEIQTRDGLTEVCYVTVPVEKDIHNNGVPIKPLPMVLLVHGGPTWRDFWNIESDVQFLANRGYAILQCNYRGSTTYGKSFLSAMFGEWGRNVYYDLVDAVDWAIRAGIADPAKVAIAGASYGGYSTLLGLTMTPDLFACGVDIVGPSNLLTLWNSIPPYWIPFQNVLAKMMGARPDTPANVEFLRSISPLFSVDRIKKPLLIAQGANDVRVNVNESDQVVNAMKAKDLPVTYLLFHNEGHGLSKPANSIAFNGVMEQFLAKCLGGRFEPLNEVLDAANVTVIEKGGMDI